MIEREHSERPLCIDLFCGLGGWTEAFLAEGYECIGFDIEAHDYGTGGYPGKLILRDVRSIHGSELKDAAIIVASPPCQEYSYMAMPWSKAKAKQAAILADTTGAMRAHLTDLFNQCFRIQREAIEAAGHHIPLIVENVRGAQKWVGRARWNYGSFYLWGDVPALMPFTFAKAMKSVGRQNKNGELHGQSINKMRDHLKVSMNFHEHEKTGKPGRSFQSAAVEDCGIKQGGDWFNSEQPSISRLTGSKSSARKAASAMIAKIPFPLAQWIARTYKP